jgi:hypothetical protein
MNFIDSTLNPIMIWLPQAFSAAMIALAAVFYYRTTHNPENPRPWFKRLAFLSVGFNFLYAAILTVGQYFVWNRDEFTKLFLDQPNYLLSYSWARFWQSAMLILALAFVFWLILRFIQKKEARFFYPGEVEMAFVLSIAVGWSNFTVFVPLAFILMIIFSLFQKIFKRERYVTIGWPFIVSAVLTFAFSEKIFGVLTFLSVLH